MVRRPRRDRLCTLSASFFFFLSDCLLSEILLQLDNGAPWPWTPIFHSRQQRVVSQTRLLTDDKDSSLIARQTHSKLSSLSVRDSFIGVLDKDL